MNQKIRHSLTLARPWLREIRFRVCGKARVRVRRGAGAGPERAEFSRLSLPPGGFGSGSGVPLNSASVFSRPAGCNVRAEWAALAGSGGVRQVECGARADSGEWWRRASCEGDRAARGPGAPRGATEPTVTAPNLIEKKPSAQCGWWELE